jgi:hypothetical protein
MLVIGINQKKALSEERSHMCVYFSLFSRYFSARAKSPYKLVVFLFIAIVIIRIIGAKSLPYEIDLRFHFRTKKEM